MNIIVVDSGVPARYIYLLYQAHMVLRAATSCVSQEDPEPNPKIHISMVLNIIYLKCLGLYIAESV